MTSMLLNDKERVVELFIENLFWGKIDSTFSSEVQSEEGVRWLDGVYESVIRWQKLHQQSRESPLIEDDAFTFYQDTEYLYVQFVRGRVDGSIKGELRDTSLEGENKK